MQPNLEQLANDLAWMESYFRPRPEMTAAVLRLRLAAASVRNSVLPYIAGRSAVPLHIAVVGGAGVGKSTVTNFLIGQVLAEANPQAGYTRHPTAFIPPPETLQRIAPDGKVGPLQHHAQPTSADKDQDIFQSRQLAAPISGLDGTIVWDCPDMTTWRATGYSTRLIEIMGLADVVVYVASDERYNDATPSDYLRLMLQAGKPVICCLTKMRAEDATKLIEHFRKEVLLKIPECAHVAATIAIPFLKVETLADPQGEAKEYRDPLIQHAHWWTREPERAREAIVRRTVENVKQQTSTLLEPAYQELSALAEWDGMIDTAQQQFASRYNQECISSHRLASFDAALVRLIQLLELPGFGKYISKTMDVLRSPYFLMKKLFANPETANPLSEETLVQSAYQSWLDTLHLQIQQKPDQHPYWKRFKGEFTGLFRVQSKDQLEKVKAQYALQEKNLIETTAQAIHQDLEKNPAALNTIRGFKFAVEAGSIGATVVTAGTHLLWSVALVPVIASMTQALVEALGKQFVEKHRETVRRKQSDLLWQQLAQPSGDWMKQWPRRQYPEMAKLHDVASRIPGLIEAMEKGLKERLKEGVAA